MMAEATKVASDAVWREGSCRAIEPKVRIERGNIPTEREIVSCRAIEPKVRIERGNIPTDEVPPYRFTIGVTTKTTLKIFS